MSTLTVWASANSVRLHQLSDNPEDGTPQEQISIISALEPFAGYNCVSEDYQGTVPAGNPAGWNWDGSAIVEVTPVPASVTPRQVRLLLLSQNLLDQVEGVIAASDKATQITWAYASEFRRNDPLLTALASQLGLSDEQVDQFFIAAAEI